MIIDNYKDVELKEETRHTLEVVEEVIKKSNFNKLFKNVFISEHYAENSVRDNNRG